MFKRVLASSAVVMCAIAAHGQAANNTSLVGTVTDASGAVVAGARVTGTNVDTKVVYTGKTNAEGSYQIPYVLPGTYDIAVQSAGFETTVTKGVIVTINIAVRTDALLKLGSENTQVTVSAENPPLSTDDAVLGETIESGRVHDLPLQGRQAIFLAQTTSNIVISGTALTGVPPGNRASGSGTRNTTNSITLDGISIINNLTSTAALTPNPDALDSVQTQNGNYTAQYGDYIGVHINMETRKGTNSFHGTVYDYIQNDAVNSRPFATPLNVRKAPVRFNQFGGAVGGPILRNRAFFLGSYEGIRQSNGTLSQGQVLTVKERTGDFSELLIPGFAGAKPVQLVDPRTQVAIPGNRLDLNGYALSPQAQNVLKYLSTPTTTAALANNFVGLTPSLLTSNNTLDRIDYTLNDKMRFFARYGWQSLTGTNGSINPTSNNYGPTRLSNGAVGFTYIVTPTVVNDLRLGFNVVSTNVLNYFAENNIQGAGSALGIPGFTSDVTAKNPGLPTINITNYQGTGGEDGTNWYQDDRTMTLFDQLTYIKGKHNVTAGFSIRRLSIGRAAQNGPRGTFSFSGQYTGDAAADFMLGVATSDITPSFQIKGSIYQFRDGFFIQDNWQVAPKLTVQYGLRYELPQVAKSLNGVGRKLDPTETSIFPAVGGSNSANAQSFPGFAFSNPNHSDFAPRLGFSYRATDKTVVRGGGGIYYNANHLNSYTLSSTNYPYSASVSYSGITAKAGNTPTVTFASPTPGAGTVTPVAGTPGTYINAFTENPNLPPATMYQWNLDVGQEMWHNAGFELQYLGSHTIHLDESFYDNQPNPDGNTTASVNSRRPNQLFGQIRKIQNDGIATYHGLTAILRQRITHGLTGTASYTWAHALDTSDSSNDGGSAMWQGHLKLDYGNSNYDIRNRFVGTVTYELPKFEGHSFAVQEALGGWQINAIIDIRTGAPINITYSGDRLNVGTPGGGQRPIYVHANSFTCNKGTLLAAGGTTRNCFDNTAFALPALGSTYGNVHRNDIHGPNQLAQNNVSLFKTFKIHENVGFQFRAEAFNVMNHANLSATPNGTFGGSSFGNITGSGSRTVQFAGKVNF